MTRQKSKEEEALPWPIVQRQVLRDTQVDTTGCGDSRGNNRDRRMQSQEPTSHTWPGMQAAQATQGD